MARTRFILTCFACTLTGACSAPIERATPIVVTVDADSTVRKATVRVEVVVEAALQAARGDRGTSWTAIEPRTFRPESTMDWPWQFRLTSEQSAYSRYSLTATARDTQGAVVAQAQTVRSRAEITKSGLRIHFDAACFRLAALCGEGLTCSEGECVSASEPSPRATDGGEPATGMRELGTSSMSEPESDGIAVAGSPCKDDARACTGYASRVPLRCESGAWREQPSCAEESRCDTTDGEHRGMCRPIAEDCAHQQPNVTFCDGETMRVCTDLVASKARTCAEHERCIVETGQAVCGCRVGYVRDPSSMRCTRANECDTMGGGCDALTQCTMVGGQPTCSACPPGFAGTGEEGCVPQLLGLTVDKGTLAPEFQPNTHSYVLRVPLFATQIELAPAAPAGVTLSVNGDTVDGNGRWRSALLAFGETKLDIVATSSSGMSTKYQVTCLRTGEQTSYLKAHNADRGDQFGISLALSEDTLVVGAFLEDSAARTINGDAADNTQSDTGAAYVFVRDGGGWKQQAYLKPSDSATKDYFGGAVTIDGDMLIATAIHESPIDPGLGTTRPGAAYVFTRSNGVWSQTQRLAATQPNGADLFGVDIARDGDTLAIGASWDSAIGERTGAVYIFGWDGSAWIERQKITSHQPTARALFGSTLALDGDRLVVGAPDDPRPARYTGSAEVFIRRDGEFVFQQVLQPAGLTANSTFSFGLDLRGDRIAVGAPRLNQYLGTSATPPGEVYVFEANGDRWEQTALLRAAHPRDSDRYGYSVSLSEELLVVGAPGDASGARGLGGDPARSDLPNSGAVYVYATTPAGFVLSAFIKAHNAERDDQFGNMLLLEGDVLVVGGTGESSADRGVDSAGKTRGAENAGAVFVFE